MAQMPRGGVIHIMVMQACAQHIGKQHGVRKRADEVRAVFLHHQHVVFDVMADDEHRRIGKERQENLQRLLQFDLAFDWNERRTGIAVAEQIAGSMESEKPTSCASIASSEVVSVSNAT